MGGFDAPTAQVHPTAAIEDGGEKGAVLQAATGAGLHGGWHRNQNVGSIRQSIPLGQSGRCQISGRFVLVGGGQPLANMVI